MFNRQCPNIKNKECLYLNQGTFQQTCLHIGKELSKHAHTFEKTWHSHNYENNDKLVNLKLKDKESGM